MTEKDRALGDTAVTTWIVDYDLPEGNIRRRFYRAISKRLDELGYDERTGWSTQSVVFTPDQDFAQFVYDQATQLGQAHLWRAQRVR